MKLRFLTKQRCPHKPKPTPKPWRRCVQYFLLKPLQIQKFFCIIKVRVILLDIQWILSHSFYTFRVFSSTLGKNHNWRLHILLFTTRILGLLQDSIHRYRHLKHTLRNGFQSFVNHNFLGCVCPNSMYSWIESCVRNAGP